MRERDKELIECSPVFKKMFSDNMRLTKLAPYPVLSAQPENAMRKVREIIDDCEDEIDIVFFDLPAQSTIPCCFHPQLSGHGDCPRRRRQGNT